MEERACAKARGRREQRAEGHLVSVELEVYKEVGRGGGWW